MGETLWWAAKYVVVLVMVVVVMAAFIGSICEANGETEEERERDYRDNCQRNNTDDLRD